ncbi:MAG TPA: flagellar hook capping FlgD N-terminal domain-containing protein [Gemmatimonadaceae bacterium]|nr:flagellar hook capping FlgD N-terminal domain-containing protein [Gemmatimonadaceae bacterium]
MITPLNAFRTAASSFMPSVSMDATPAANSSGAVAAAAAQATAPGGALGKDQFLKMLIAQLQNQDPLNPMQGDQMATQLAQFSSLEQLQEINTTLSGQQTSQGALLGALQANAAMGMIGHTVIAQGDQLQLGGANAQSSVTVNLGSAGASGTLHIYDSTGREVGTRDVGALDAGKQTIDLGSAADGLPDGTYTYALDVKSSAGTAVDVTTYTTGKVDGVSTGANGLVLTAGGLTIPYANVTQILN